MVPKRGCRCFCWPWESKEYMGIQIQHVYPYHAIESSTDAQDP